MNAHTTHDALYAAVFKLMRPLARVLLRNGVAYGAFADIAKRAFVDVAMRDMEVPGKKSTASRASTLTGLSRKEIKRVLEFVPEDDRDLTTRYNRAARVVYGWVHDKRYSNYLGTTLDLDFEGSLPSFSALVKAYSGDIPPRAILDELLQVGVVGKTEDGKIRLLQRAYIPKSSQAEKLSLLGRDVAGLISTMEHNIHGDNKKPLFQRKVFYDNLPQEEIPKLQALLAEKGQKLLEYLDLWMVARDRDTNPYAEGTGRKAAGIGIYYFEEPVEEQMVHAPVYEPEEEVHET